MGLSVDGFVATSEGLPAWLKSPDFVPARSHGYQEFIAGCDAVLMGRETFVPALRAPTWPWGDMQVFVLTSRPLPPETPPQVVTSAQGPAGLIEKLRSRGSSGDVHLVGGPRTIQAVYAAGALDSLDVILLPIVFGEGMKLWPNGTPPPSLRILGEPRAFADGSVGVSYSTAGA